MKTDYSKIIALSFGVLVMSLLISFIVLAWTGPGESPPSGNVDAPQRRVSGTCATGSSIRVINSNGTVSCQTDTSGSSIWNQSGSNIYYNSGNVGIGTINSNPDAKLEVRGNLRLSTLSSVVGFAPQSDGSLSILGYGGSGWQSMNIGSSFVPSDAKLSVGGLYSSGNVIIENSLSVSRISGLDLPLNNSDATNKEFVIDYIEVAAGGEKIGENTDAASMSDTLFAGQQAVYDKVDNAYSAAFTMLPRAEQRPYARDRCSTPSCPPGWTSITTFLYSVHSAQYDWMTCTARVCALPR